ncbi:MAG: Crp/Fnr family transcriptional regulator [Bacteroidota bacterium]
MTVNQSIPTCKCENCELRDMFFNHLSHDEMIDICSIRKELKFNGGDNIIQKGDPVERFMYLKEGMVKLHLENASGMNQIITFARPLDFISILSVFSSGTYQYDVTALIPSTVCVVDMSLIELFSEKNPRFTMDLMRRLSKATDNILHESLELKRLHLKGKLAYVLNKFSGEIFDSHIFELPVTRKEIAEYAGVSTENIIRGLSEFRKDKLIRINGKEIELLEPERIKRIAAFG